MHNVKFTQFYKSAPRLRSVGTIMLGACVGWLITSGFPKNTLNDPPFCRQNQTNYVATSRTFGLPSVYEVDWSKWTDLRRRVKILCYINTIPKTFETKAKHVMNTWARQCTKLLFVSSAVSENLPVVNLNLTYPESRKHLWSKMQKALHYVYQFRDQYDFFYKADDDTYAILDNLLHALKDLNPDEPILAGYPFRHIIPQGHMSGGAGYILSHVTLKRLVEQGLNKHPECPTFDEDLEDVKLSMCAYAVGAQFVPIIDRHSTIPYITNDLRRMEYRFQWMDLSSLFQFELTLKRKQQQFIKFDPHNPFIRDQHNLLSELLISLHYVSPKLQYLYHFLTYYLKPVGIVHEP